MHQLGCPPGEFRGLTELVVLGNDEFAAGDTFTQGGVVSKLTLKDVGWSKGSGLGGELWLVVKK